MDIRLQTIISQLFGIEDDQFRNDLLENSQVIELDGGDTLFRKGEQSDHMYILVSGRLHAIVNTDGAESIVGEIGIGETVGEMALITEEPRSAKVVAIRDSVLLDISKANFEELVKSYPTALWNITKLVIKRLNKSINAPRHQVSYDNFAFINLSKDNALMMQFIENVKPGIAQLGTVFIMKEEEVAAHFGTTVDEMDYSRSNHQLTAWITEMEKKHDYLILSGSETNEPWTRRCIRQADKIILVGTPQDLTTLNPIEKTLLSGGNKVSTAEQELLILHPKGTIQRIRSHFWKYGKSRNTTISKSAIRTT